MIGFNITPQEIISDNSYIRRQAEIGYQNGGVMSASTQAHSKVYNI